MTPQAQRIGVVRSMLELLGIVLVKFRPVPRIWGTWLVAVNAAALLFIAHVEAWVVLGAVGLALLAQGLIYQRARFIRILGSTHVLWLPMIVWMALRLEAIPKEDVAFRAWVVALIATNAASLAIDAWDATRFLRGERTPYYAW